MTIITRNLVDEGGGLDAEIKRLKKRLDQIKEELTDHFIATGEVEIKADAYKVKFSSADVFEPLSPLNVYDAMKKYDDQGSFFSIITVRMTDLRKHLPEKDIIVLQGESTGKKVSMRFGVVK